MVFHWQFSSVFGLICRRSNKACVDLAKADPALANAFYTATNFKSCRCPRFDIRDQISMLTFGASNHPVFSGRSYLASFSLNFVSDDDDQLLSKMVVNWADTGLLVWSSDRYLAANVLRNSSSLSHSAAFLQPSSLAWFSAGEAASKAWISASESLSGALRCRFALLYEQATTRESRLAVVVDVEWRISAIDSPIVCTEFVNAATFLFNITIALESSCVSSSSANNAIAAS